MISLTSFTYLVADQWIKCDAFTIWCDLKLKYPEVQKGINVWFQGWRGIGTGDQYLEYKFDVVDEETGEVTEMVMSCRIDMNKLMVKQGWYPPIILQAFKKFKA